MNVQSITVKGVEDKGSKIVFITENGKYEFFKTGWDKSANGGQGGPGTEDSKPYLQFKQMPNPMGRTLQVDVYEKERSFVGRENKEITYTQRTINEFLVGGGPADPTQSNSTPTEELPFE